MHVRRRLLVAIAIALLVASVAFGAAATLGGLVAGDLGAGEAAVASCDADGVSVSYTVSGGLVTAVTVSDISAACTGGQLSLTLANGAGTSIGSGGPLAVAGSSLLVALSLQPTPSNVAAIHILVEGP